jgi:23S rRNA (cytosine1962-C5)-methyltransferase
VFSNEIASMEGAPETGAVVSVVDASKNLLGVGLYNKTSLIAVRMLSRGEEIIDKDFFERRIAQADSYRKQLFPGATAYRMVHGESDFLPGLLIDRFNDHYAIQILSAGMEKFQNEICDVLKEKYSAKSIIAKNDSHLRALEGLERETNILHGEFASQKISDGDIFYEVDIASGQKTGFFFDQRENRKAIRLFSKGARVLDCFCNTGGFSLHAAAAGAAQVTGIDSSSAAIAAAKRNAEINGLACSFVEGDVVEQMKEYVAKKEQFDLVVLDPPAFAKNRKTLPAARNAYAEINTLAMLLLKSGGVLATASCSHHLSSEMFGEVVSSSAAKTHRKLQLIERRGASPDHPVLLSMPETEYLKFLLCRVV